MDKLNEIWSLMKSDLFIVIWLLLGIVFIIISGFLICMKPPNYQVGLPSFGFGFAFFAFGINLYSNAKSRKKLDAIEDRLKKIEDSPKKL